MDFRLKDKVILAAASSEGLGFGIAEQAVREGARVFIGSRDRGKVDEAVSALEGSAPPGGRPRHGDGDSIAGWVEAGISAFGTADGLLVNAGGPPPDFRSLHRRGMAKSLELTLLSWSA
jgi:3-oxoacyl-[acyl-carrier protein] reductase